MADATHEPVRRSALAAVYREGVHAVDGGSPAVTLRERRPLELAHVAGHADDAAFTRAVEGTLGLSLPTVPNETTSKDGLTLCWLAPDRWLAVAPATPPARLVARLAEACDGRGAVNDVSSGRTVIRVSGTKAREVLEAGCPLDLHPQSFRPGDCAQSLLGHTAVLLHAVEPHAIDVFVARGFGRDLWEWLTHHAADYGYRVDAPSLA